MRLNPSRRILLLAVLACAGAPAVAELESNVRMTKHNLSVSGTGTVRAQTQTEVCVFCHTPHGADTSVPGAPLWNHKLQNQTYTTYLSSSIDATLVNNQLEQPAGSSKLCLSCHDGTLAIGAVNTLAGQRNVTVGMTGTEGDGSMPGGIYGASSGFTRDLGIDLRNDHPVSVTYDLALANRDGELRVPDGNQKIRPGIGDVVAVRDHRVDPKVRPLLPLEKTGPIGDGQIQCATCHDPHIRDTTDANIKFLRANRFQKNTPQSGADFDKERDIICLACHDKDLGSGGWALSAHANPSVANEAYKSDAANTREFPSGTPVWAASCLNCHDTHAVQGTRRLAREGTDDSNTPKRGGASAIEETCYQCHRDAAGSALSSVTQVPNIRGDFLLPRRMPITNADQAAGAEAHDIGTGQDGDEGTRRGIDGVEDQILLGKGNLDTRHVECTDCHNPHRVITNRLFNANAGSPDAAGTHNHAAGHTNLASGALRGSVGVEPVYTSTSFQDKPSDYDLKRGVGTGTAATALHVTREYQICLKCHSDYAYDDNNIYPSGTRPNLGDSGGGTTSGTNGLTQFTNQAKEFQAPTGHRGEVSASNTGAGTQWDGTGDNNHRSWHPVMDSTGRSLGTRSIATGANPFMAPWNGTADVGNQTMYCSDCHGSNTANNSVVPTGGEDGSPWGPHGSTNNFVLKGAWNAQTGGNSRDVPATDPNNGLCFKCHDFRSYADRNGNGNESGFGGPKSQNLHAFHADKIGQMHCTWCHVAVPHGWKNKALLVNLNDVGPEAGLPAGTEIPSDASNDVYNQQPYYLGAKLKVITFAPSGQWQDSNCGSNGRNVAGNDRQTGKDWMQDVCSNPP